MSNLKKLSTFRQLSLNCETSTLEQRRKSFKKQFSEDLPDIHNNWLEPEVGFKISLSAKNRKTSERPLPIKIAWDEISHDVKTEEAVIIKKIPEGSKTPPCRLNRHNSVEKESILSFKQEVKDRLQEVLKETPTEKTNLKIFLAHNAKLMEDNCCSKDDTKSASPPKLIQPLTSTIIDTNNKNLFNIRKTTKQPKIHLQEKLYSPSRTNNKPKSNTIVVTPIIEKLTHELPTTIESENNNTTTSLKESIDQIKPINNVIIRPLTAKFRRELFQKCTNSAFNSTVKETSHARPPLVRSSSAPTKPSQQKSKFIASKRRIKTAKRTQFKSQSIDEVDFNKENPKNQKVLNRTVSINATEIVTMVSLVSPAGSDNEEFAVEYEKEKCNSQSKASNNNNKASGMGKDEKEKEVTTKNLSLRKTVKSVSFQQSSIHAIRSFSASFPSRRSSMAAALMLGSNLKTGVCGQKGHEKRSTNASSPDDDERVPKRRLVRSHTEEPHSERYEEVESIESETADVEAPIHTTAANISVDIQSKSSNEGKESDETRELAEITLDIEDESKKYGTSEDEDDKPKFESAKEKQCWEMFCKMTEKGVTVSYDTILRGLLTPTEYRMSKQKSLRS